MLTIVVPTLNAAKHLPRLLASINTQTVQPRVMFVDGGSTDTTLDLLNGWEVIRVPGSTIYGAQNISLDYIDAGLVYFMGADDWLENPRFVEEVLDHGGTCQGKTRFSSLPVYTWGPRQQNYIYRRDILAKFNEANLVYADLEFNKALPFQIERVNLNFCVVEPGGFSARYTNHSVAARITGDLK